MPLIIVHGKVDFSQIPKNPGCYIYKNVDGEIIYIGKAKNLLNRVRSYFSNSEQHSVKTRHLVSKIYSIDWIIVDNEVEALLLENNLIKKHYPKYNIDLKDNKRYAYIKITNEKFPRILSTRIVGKDGTYFGPYTDGYQRVQLIRTAVSIFKLRVCKTLPKNACLNYHIGICTAPCIKNVDEIEYSKQVARAKEFLKGNMDDTIKQLTEEMKKYSAEMKFEKALERKRQLEAIAGILEKQKVELVKGYDQDVICMIKYNDNVIIEIFTIAKGVISGKSEYKIEYSEDVFEEFLKRYYSARSIPQEIIVNQKFYDTEQDKEILEEYFCKLRNGKVTITYPEKGDKLSLIKMAEKNALMNLEENNTLKELQEKLNLPGYPKIIECFDISNLGYEHIVAGMTRFVDGRPDKTGYRKFMIKSNMGKQDDFMAMGEVVYRRYKRIKQERGEYPGLIIIDGGLGQLNAALRSLKHLGLKIPIISLAKQNEEIYTPSSKEPMQFEKNSKMMLLLREIRDSVHDFVLGYNKKRREMKLRDQFKDIDNTEDKE
ncbi:MAG TPA: excinuclease ABC subunit UvrC [Alphaproteobacteria bacterium]|nr:excinuclease ABC subunit UvrC [Alphaproteobacteria bacterium]